VKRRKIGVIVKIENVQFPVDQIGVTTQSLPITVQVDQKWIKKNIKGTIVMEARTDHIVQIQEKGVGILKVVMEDMEIVLGRSF